VNRPVSVLLKATAWAVHDAPGVPASAACAPAPAHATAAAARAMDREAGTPQWSRATAHSGGHPVTPLRGPPNCL